MTNPPRVVADVLAAVRGTTVTDLEVEWEGGSLHLRRDVGTRMAPADQTAPEAMPDDGQTIVRSAYVGIFRRESDKGFPLPGEQVGEQTRLGEVETLGIRNAVRPSVAGTLVEMLVEDQTPVEFGQPLAIVLSATTHRA